VWVTRAASAGWRSSAPSAVPIHMLLARMAEIANAFFEKYVFVVMLAVRARVMPPVIFSSSADLVAAGDEGCRAAAGARA
jgi:hypothetical protein